MANEKTCFGNFNWDNTECKNCKVNKSCYKNRYKKKASTSPFPFKTDYVRKLTGQSSINIVIPKNIINKLSWKKGDLIQFKIKEKKLELELFK